jgi:rubrerythrin
MSSCLDLRKYQGSDEVHSAFSKIISGKAGYKAAKETQQEILKCSKCGYLLQNNEKFCPECGTKAGC